MKRKVGLLLIALSLAGFFSFLPLIYYGLQQLKGQLNIISGSVEIEKLMDQDDFPDSLKLKLRLVSEIRDFSFDELGLTMSENYTSFYHQNDKPSLWVLSACPEFSLKPYVWKFPFAGAFPYKGFFNWGRGVEEELVLRKLHFDTDLSPVEGWSTLGFFKDPILSNMLRRDEGWLANLIIHELTHGTIFFKDSVEFNENLANFIGIKGSIKFLEMKYGVNNEIVKNYILDLNKRQVFSDFLIRMAPILDSTYKSFDPDQSILKKREIKKSAFRKIKLKWDRTKEKLLSDSIPETVWVLDNTLFAAFLRYNSEQNTFEKELKYKYGGSLKLMIQELKNQK